MENYKQIFIFNPLTFTGQLAKLTGISTSSHFYLLRILQKVVNKIYIC